MKNSYILLRNNIESSSLSFEDIKEIGLQSTDLIWVECQSVCWQQPSEISELKEIVATEEQLMIEKKLDLIDNKTAVEKNIETSASFISEFPEMDQYGNPENDKTTLTKKKGVGLKTNFIPQKDELKELHINYPEQKEKQLFTLSEMKLPENAKRILLYTGLVLSGALIMLLIKSFDSKKPLVVQEQKQEAPIPNTTNEVLLEAPETDSLLTAGLEEIKATEETLFDPRSFEQQQAIASNKKKTSSKNDRTSTTPIANETADHTPTQLPIQKEVRKIPIENIAAKLSIAANDYNVGSFGGIKNLELSLQNKSQYLLDKVTVKIEYLNPEGKTVNSEHIYFQSIQAGDAATIPVEKSKRGVTIDYKITKIESKELTAHNSSTIESNNYSRN